MEGTAEQLLLLVGLSLEDTEASVLPPRRYLEEVAAPAEAAGLMAVALKLVPEEQMALRAVWETVSVNGNPPGKILQLLRFLPEELYILAAAEAAEETQKIMVTRELAAAEPAEAEAALAGQAMQTPAAEEAEEAMPAIPAPQEAPAAAVLSSFAVQTPMRFLSGITGLTSQRSDSVLPERRRRM